ncbi:MAG TPA: histidine phosphatase family protein [Pseudonocardiaceae bacterium]|nr:histidine phosphatase family protein [Pseudonocardiaceae bacterium]
MRLFLVRHGQTESNVRMVLDSRPPGPPLNLVGQQQAVELAESLAGEPVVGVYASTAIRAQQTAAPVAAKHDLPVQVVPGAQEVFVGDLEGRTDHGSVGQFFTAFSAWSEGDLDVPLPGGETGRQVRDRFERVVADIRAAHQHGVVVLVSHGGVIRLVAPMLATNVKLAVTEYALLPNTGRVVLVDEPGPQAGWRCVEWTGLDLA